MSPISRLSADIWSLITPALHYDDIKNLLFSGDARLMQVVGHGTRMIKLASYLHAIDVECLFRTARAAHYLQKLHVHPLSMDTMAMKPLLPLQTLPKLTSLTALFANSISFFLIDQDLPKLAPSLTSLALGGETGTELSFSELKFPPDLQQLRLSGPIATLQSGDIAKLPRSLTILAFSTRSIPPMDFYDWPPDLQSLSLARISESLAVEILPRTLSYLSILGPPKLTTSFKTKNPNDHFAFPWRCFFPSLNDLFLDFRFTGDALETLKSFVCADAYQASEIEDFLSSGFWQHQATHSSITGDYPLYKRLNLHHSDQIAFTRASQALAPYLTNVEHFYVWGPSLEIYNYYPSAQYVYSPTAVEAPLPPLRCASFTGSSQRFEFIEPLTSLRDLSLTYVQSTDKASVKWPPALEGLVCSVTLTGPMLQYLPSSLTRFAAPIRYQSDWTILATNLPLLGSLSIVLNPMIWNGSDDNAEPLTPILGIAALSIKLEDALLPQQVFNRPFLDEFFGKLSPLPTSLTKLSVHGFAMQQRIPLTIFPYLPRQLRILTVSAFIDWRNEFYKTEPHIASMTSGDLLASLPSGLDVLDLSLYAQIPGVQQPYEMLASLPRGLKSFKQNSIWNHYSLLEADIETILNSLPPKLCSLKYGSSTAIETAYFKARPYLYQ